MTEYRTTKQGPNVKKLIAHKMAKDAVPDGGGLAAALKFLKDKDAIVNTARRATEFVYTAIALMRTCAEPNPWKDASDEEIAGEILKNVEEKLSARRRVN